MKLNYLKNYFLVFFITYLILIATKFIFIFYLQNNFSEFGILEQIKAIFWGYKFDFATSAAIALLSTLFDFNKKLLKFITALLITTIFLTQIGDILYFNEASRHIGYEITDTFTDATSLFMTAYSQHKILTISSIILGIILFLSLLSVEFKKINFTKTYILKKILLILISVFFIRGMAQHIPLTPWQSNQIGDTKLASISLNASYNIIYSLSTKSKKLKQAKIPTVSKEMTTQSFKELYKEKNSKVDLPFI